MAARNFDRARTFGDKFQVVKAYGSYEELSKDSEVGKTVVALVHELR